MLFAVQSPSTLRVSRNVSWRTSGYGGLETVHLRATVAMEMPSIWGKCRLSSSFTAHRTLSPPSPPLMGCNFTSRTSPENIFADHYGIMNANSMTFFLSMRCAVSRSVKSRLAAAKPRFSRRCGWMADPGMAITWRRLGSGDGQQAKWR